MRYRRLDEDGDYTFGQGSANFLVDTPACVAQSVLTRLCLWAGEWFLDDTEGTLWLQQILSAQIKNTTPFYDQAIRSRILQTEGVTGIVEYSSELNGRQLTVTAKINTRFGTTTITATS